jgi:hypothetical protein
MNNMYCTAQTMEKTIALKFWDRYYLHFALAASTSLSRCNLKIANHHKRVLPSRDSSVLGVIFSLTAAVPADGETSQLGSLVLKRLKTECCRPCKV